MITLHRITILFFFLGLSLSLLLVSCGSSSKSKKPEIKTTSPSSAPSDSTPSDSILSVPLQSKGQWQVLEYGKIPSNKVSFSSKGLTLNVDNSASPLVYPFAEEPVHVKEVQVEGTLDRLVSINPANKQGQKGFDDFNLRVGLVILGSKTISWAKKAFSPKWVRTLFNLAPKGQGIDHIYFINAVLAPELIGQSRDHPSTEYIKEENAWLMDKTGSFSYSYKLSKSLDVGALWISIDGDDTNSKFNITINKLNLKF